MLEGILVGIVTASIMILINAMVRRVGVQTRTDRAKKDIEELKDGQHVMLKALIAVLIAQRDGKTNGECKEALKALNEFLIRK